MKNTIRMTMFAATVALLSTSVFAQAPSMRVHIPFAFAAGETRLPAGNYRVVLDPMFHVFRVEQEGGSSVYMPMQKTSMHAAQVAGSIFFNKYGDRYFLTKVARGGDSVEYEWPQSRAEREIAKTGVPVELAFVRVASH